MRQARGQLAGFSSGFQVSGIGNSLSSLRGKTQMTEEEGNVKLSLLLDLLNSAFESCADNPSNEPRELEKTGAGKEEPITRYPLRSITFPAPDLTVASPNATAEGRLIRSSDWEAENPGSRCQI